MYSLRQSLGLFRSDGYVQVAPPGPVVHGDQFIVAALNHGFKGDGGHTIGHFHHMAVDGGGQGFKQGVVLVDGKVWSPPGRGAWIEILWPDSNGLRSWAVAPRAGGVD